MSSNSRREQPKMVSWTVMTVGGTAVTHSYHLPPAAAEATRFVISIDTIISSALSGETKTLRLANPMVTYNPAYIISIAFDSYGQAELDNAVGEVERTAGFRTASH